MRHFIAKLICRLTKHKRGRRMQVIGARTDGLVAYQCPRCHAVWNRKVKA